MANAAALAGIRIVDFTHVIAGPLATQILGDLGAEVTKIEPIGRGDLARNIGPHVNGQSHYFLCFNRNKRSIELDLKSEEGLKVVRKLIEKADVVVENFGPGVMARLGLDYASLKEMNEGLIYCSISGFGQNGPLKEKRSLDLVTQGYAGIMSANGEPNMPPLKLGLPFGDTSGSLFAVIAIQAALAGRHQDGRGRFIDLGLYDCLLAMLANHAGHYLATGAQPERTGSSHYFCVPNGVFPVRDGYITIAVTNEFQWDRLCEALDLKHLKDDKRFADMASRVRMRKEVDRLVTERLQNMSAEQAIATLDKAEIPAGPVHSIGEAVEHPQTAARNMVLNLSSPYYGEFRAVSLPIDGGLQRDGKSPPPVLGEHTDQILEELGYDAERIEALRRSGAIGRQIGERQ